jgi:hypothetical protein
LVLGISPLTRKADLIDLAFDRLGWVRVVAHKDETRYELVGIARRRQKTCMVSAATAAHLVAAGLPTVVRNCEHCEAGAC